MIKKSVLALLLILQSCSHSGVKSSPKVSETALSASTETEANLTQTEAETRAALIRDVDYRLKIHVDASHDTFRGEETIRFRMARSAATFLDFKNGAVLESVVVNGTPSTLDYKDHRLALPATLLREGANEISISYRQTYSHDGRGLHRFVDPEDQRVYLYSQFEAYDAHQMFACFDQPDLKAEMTLSVVAPKNWSVITTTRESSITGVKDKTSSEVLWTFPKTPRLSTYLFSLHAGPYSSWSSSRGATPLRLFVRQTMKAYVSPEDWFKPTREGLRFYDQHFAYPYPFKKFDLVIAPDFNAGAMENVAAITFSERYVKRGSYTREEREAIASVILHEMAHMWFGDLVTMKWWNGLWLNESFATFMSAESQAKATEFRESWISFFQEEKQWAYFEDQAVTTHPIEAVVPDVATANTNFDGITYGKGASVLKQLNFYLGDEKFREGVRSYFKTYAYKNTTLADFMGSLSQASGLDLSSWSKNWLESAGLDSVKPVFACEGGRLTRFQLIASGPQGPTPRTHKTRVSLYDSSMKRFRSGDVIYSDGTTTVDTLKDAKCPSFVDTNDDDHDYVKTKFDPASLESLKSKAIQIKDPFARLRIWPSLQQMVRDQELSPVVYLEVAKAVLPLERDLKSAQQLAEPLAQMLYYLPVATLDQRRARLAWVTTLETRLWDRLQSSTGDFQKMMLSEFTQIAESKPAKDHLFDLLTGAKKPQGLKLDQDRRWALLVRLSYLGDPRAKDLVAKEAQSDRSELGIQMTMAAEAARPDRDIKRYWFNELLTNTDAKYARLRAATRTMFLTLQDDLKASFADDYFAQLPKFAVSRVIDVVDLFVAQFDPAVCTSESASKIRAFLDAHKDLPPSVLRQMSVDLQEDERCVAIRGRSF